MHVPPKQGAALVIANGVIVRSTPPISATPFHTNQTVERGR